MTNDNVPERIWICTSEENKGEMRLAFPNDLQACDIEYARVQEIAAESATHRCPHFMPKGEDSGGAYNALIIQDVSNDLLDGLTKDRLSANPRSWYSLLIKELIQRIANLRVMLSIAAPGKVSEEDEALAHEIMMSGNSRYVDPTLSDKIAAALAAVRKEALKLAAKDVCMYCSGNATGYEVAIGPNSAGNYTHEAINKAQLVTTGAKGIVLCSASSIHARMTFEASANMGKQKGGDDG